MNIYKRNGSKHNPFQDINITLAHSEWTPHAHADNCIFAELHKNHNVIVRIDGKPPCPHNLLSIIGTYGVYRYKLILPFVYNELLPKYLLEKEIQQNKSNVVPL